jgi:hypothetical protein
MLEADEVARAARGMIVNYGRRAASEAEKRAQNLLAFGETDTVASWQQIAAAIHRMGKNERGDGVGNA